MDIEKVYRAENARREESNIYIRLSGAGTSGELEVSSLSPDAGKHLGSSREAEQATTFLDIVGLCLLTINVTANQFSYLVWF